MSRFALFEDVELIALSSAEAEFYAMVDGVLRAKWAQTVLGELGFSVSPLAELCVCTDSSAAKSFVSRKGLGRMRHLLIRDLWLQKEVGEGRVFVSKVLGTENPADAMMKFLGAEEIRPRLAKLNIVFDWAC